MKEPDNIPSNSKSILQTRLRLKKQAGDSVNNWMAKNRSLVLRQTPVWAQSLALILVGLGGIALTGSIFFRIDEVINVQGQLKSIGGTVEVKTPVGGIVSEVFFKDGQIVQKGDLLIRFDTRQALNDKETLGKQIKYQKEQLKNQLRSIDSQILTVNGRSEVLQNRLKTKSEIVEEMRQLVIKGGFQRISYLEQRDQLFELQKEINELEEQKFRVKLEKDRAILASQKSIDNMSGSLRNAELKILYQNVTAPISGIVFDPKIGPEGVLSSGEKILSIVPQKGLYAEVFVPNKDIGYIQINQKASVRVDAFPFSRYGELPASVSQIGADALPPNRNANFYRFPVKLNLDSNELKSNGVVIPLKSGMSISTNLKLRDKRVISLVSDIFVDQADSVRSIRQQ